MEKPNEMMKGEEDHQREEESCRVKESANQ